MNKRMFATLAVCVALGACASPPPAPGCPGTDKKPINGRDILAPKASGSVPITMSEGPNGNKCRA
jgi:hypothetical protein